VSGKRGRGLSYREAGVDIDAGDRAVELIKAHAKTTFRSGVLGDLGGFAGAFDLSGILSDYDNPVLVSSTDGVGTKLEIAREMDRHDTVGIDLVAMVADDIVCTGAQPLFFNDYVACGSLRPERIERIVAGIAEGCRQAGCALVGGETAEHPGVMEPDEYDLAGFGVGIVERQRMWGPDRVRSGDVVIGIASSGLHSNGYSLVRAVVRDRGLDLEWTPEGWSRTLGEELLTPTRIYARAVLGLDADVHAAVHVTGGGIAENLVRVLPRTLRASIKRSRWPEPRVFALLRDEGEISEDEMARTFNLGLGMLLVAARGDAGAVIAQLDGLGFPAYEVGGIVSGNRGVVFEA
jgi:phosphoribosylformylglycinamidine cyclo-ligase